jgi:heat shock protein HspQ
VHSPRAGHLLEEAAVMGTVTRFRDRVFSVGDVIVHRRFGYRGVIVAVDATFQLSEAWYRTVARSQPPKDQPWYHVLVDGSTSSTYVAERHLDHDDSGEPVDHPMIDDLFCEFMHGKYLPRS